MPASRSSAVSGSRTRCSARAIETLLLLPPWSIVHSRFWKLQVPYLARHFRVITFDGRGNGRSDRPDSAADYGARGRRRRRARRPRRHRHLALRARGPLRGGRQRTAAGGESSRARPGRPLHVAGAADLAAASRADRLPLRRAAAGVRGLGEGESPLLGAGLPRLPGVLLRPLLSGAALDQADRGLDRLGPGDHARRRSRSRSRPPDSTSRPCASCSAASAARCSSRRPTRTT